MGPSMHQDPFPMSRAPTREPPHPRPACGCQPSTLVLVARCRFATVRRANHATTFCSLLVAPFIRPLFLPLPRRHGRLLTTCTPLLATVRAGLVRNVQPLFFTLPLPVAHRTCFSGLLGRRPRSHDFLAQEPANPPLPCSSRLLCRYPASLAGPPPIWQHWGSFSTGSPCPLRP